MSVMQGKVQGSNPVSFKDVQVDANGNIQVSIAGTAAGTGITKTDKSGTITTGGTAQTLMAANANRKGYQVQNVSNNNLWVNEIGGTAVQNQPSILLPPTGLYEPPLNGVSTAAISIIGPTTGQAFTAREW